ncbi:mannose-1-phosphate guanyltransferase [Cylindrospermopsis raciborskii S07]|jgi:mannose-1-phosphate guanylyltransferase|uniref:UTP--glucose-1-phosphate uridylyltransferase n=3 Tax=Cylindrospermopsis raciborskii TaxID=77022 RepID=A0A853MBT1_9CYAN|nr:MULTISPECIES: NDP-sugar synthase [Cylindrospermopsis]MBU6344709.1 NDP-sugar synthase [Cyanobacteria bacterium REEB494]EFA68567.1 Nucleotidyl transferase [Cylindrospermopsis raciborskii CS-505]KRH97560.1 mannose-1-phosphate guanyltransferase [Cylindrospermopsis sp. CR12]MBA4446860.1 NDP-sugar synthase [Cylindrospermopsis raciborskii CS-506_C]MBA4451096.1 NDP-sugar synthase [Cylindrospermopsis raciborskii CS-506_D]
MKAMILAAGKGTRVRPITYTIPKPMIPILQKPVMEFLLELLRKHGFDQIMVNVSHLAEEIENYFRDGQRFGVQIGYSFEGKIDDQGKLVGEAIGSAGGMRRIQDFSPFFDETFVVLCGDALIDLDLTAAVKWHRSKGAMATIITKSVPQEEVSSYGVVVTDHDNRVRAFQEKPSVEEALSTNINTGIYIFEPEVFKYIPSGVEYDIGSQLFPHLVEINAPFYAIPMDFEWVDIGKVPDYWRAIRGVLLGEIKNVQIPGYEVAPNIYTGLNVAVNWDRVDITGPVYIGAMTRIEDGAKIVGPSMIGPNCWICGGATVDNSVIFEWSRLGPGVRLVDKLVFGRYCVDKMGAAIDVQAAALDWLITDARQTLPAEIPPEHQAIAELLGAITV